MDEHRPSRFLCADMRLCAPGGFGKSVKKMERERGFRHNGNQSIEKKKTQSGNGIDDDAEPMQSQRC
ncbi:hypothetical protein JS533_011430 [Bifidobacterium amazonense]|uniref:Uncharacterized protein n=1 Tax=Bifidobacterium amazonense TaxID=2809027 RepID=A0ABS9VY35_9BIFI|nr:hypothetical protein [Bifidobacterium amazonense]MCH9276874.1 hypothetical protein [Bifidobacterium amazonense]